MANVKKRRKKIMSNETAIQISFRQSMQIGKVKKMGKRVSHNLSDMQKQRRIKIDRKEKKIQNNLLF